MAHKNSSGGLSGLVSLNSLLFALFLILLGMAVQHFFIEKFVSGISAGSGNSDSLQEEKELLGEKLESCVQERQLADERLSSCMNSGSLSGN